MRMSVKFVENDQRLLVKFSETDKKFKANFGTLQTITEYIGGERYTGEYEVTPAIEAQTLPTAKKVLEKNLQINGIPYAEVTNQKGGKTVTIG